MVAWITFITAVLGLVTALVNTFFSREHRISDNLRFREVHDRIDDLE